MSTSYGEDGSVMIEYDRDGVHVAALVHNGILSLYVEDEGNRWEVEEEAPIENPQTVQ